MFDDVRDLYSDTIRAHGRDPRHAVRPPGFDRSARGDNPMCGDRVTVFLRRAGDTVDEAGFEARGCELVRASADLMCETVAGRSAADVRRLSNEVHTLARTGQCAACDAAMAALKPLSAVHEFPSRIRCVTLPWAALVAALDGRQEADLD